MKILITFLACICLALGACPDVITRSKWGARPPRGQYFQDTPVPYVVIHHGASASCSDQASCSAMVRAYQNQHMDVNGWPDIGYSYLVGEDGNVYYGRGWDQEGAHAPGYNTRSIGICFIGTFTDRAPNSAALAAAKLLIECGIGKGMVRPDYKLIGHRQGSSTECPGNSLYAEIKTWSHYEPNPSLA